MKEALVIAVTFEQAKRISDAWMEASDRDRLRMSRIDVPTGPETSHGHAVYYEIEPLAHEASAFDRLAELEAALLEIRAAIMASATDTLWMDTTCPETIVDRIDAALAN